LTAADCIGLQPSILIEVWTAWAIFWFRLALTCIVFSSKQLASAASIVVTDYTKPV
jgi:hypothetical protein